jgi:undecaprenyl pyrophosphate phosphatase UppP
MKKLNNEDPVLNSLIDQFISFQEKFMSYSYDIEKQQVIWMYHILTISAAIIGGFVLSKSDRNSVENIALSFLFIFTFTSFFMLYYLYTYRAKQIRQGAKDIKRYYSLAISLRILSKKENLSVTEKKLFDKYLKDFKKMIIDTIRLEQLEKQEDESERYIPLAPILVICIFICIICLIFSNQINDLLG